jgi:hypothetical protein
METCLSHRTLDISGGDWNNDTAVDLILLGSPRDDTEIDLVLVDILAMFAAL